MRILQVSCACSPLHPGGVANLTRRISEHLVADGHRVMVFTLMNSPLRKRDEIYHRNLDGFRLAAFNHTANIDFFDRYRIKDYLNPAVHEPFRRLVDSFAPDVIHFQAIQGLGAGLLDWVPEGVPTVLTMHDYWWVCPNLFLAHLDGSLCDLHRRDPMACERCLCPLPKLNPTVHFGLPEINHRTDYLGGQLKKVSRILAVSHQLRDRLKGFLPDFHIDVCENGIEWNGNVSARSLRRRNGHRSGNPRPLRFGFLGGQNPHKGYKCIQDAVGQISNPNFRVDAYGCSQLCRLHIARKLPGARSVYRRLLARRGLADDSSLDGRIVLHPTFSQHRREQVYASFNVLLVPSTIRESFSLVCREALLAGVPVIASRCGGPEEIIRQEENGLLFEPGNVTELARCMARCLQETELLPSLRAHANSHGIRSIGDHVRQIEQVYDTVTS